MLSKSERDFHRKAAARCFNETWDYLDMKARTKQDDERMLTLAHASRFHWGLVGSPRNTAVGDWQISRVYAALKEPRLSLLFATTSLDTCKKEKLSEQLAPAYEGMARACAVSENYQSARKYARLARKQLDGLDLRSEEKKVYLDQIKDTEKLILR